MNTRTLAMLLMLSAGLAAPGRPGATTADDSSDLALRVEAGRRGHDVRFFVDVVNVGGAPATDVVVDVLLRRAADAGRADLHFGETGPFRCDDAALSCRLDGLEPGKHASIELFASPRRVDAATSIGVEFRVAGSAPDAVPCNNSYYSSVFLREGD